MVTFFAAPQQSHRNRVAWEAQQSDTNSDLQSIEDLTCMGFCSPNYSPIPPIDNTKQQGAPVPTSTPKMDEGFGLNTSVPTHNRAKMTIMNSPAAHQESVCKPSKGGKVKSSQGTQQRDIAKPSTSSHTPSHGVINI